MKKWVKRVGGAFGMALTWAVGWAVVGALIGMISGFLEIPEEAGLDPWMALATPGFVGGVIFSVVLWIAEGGRRFEELSLLRIAAWGAVAGLILGLIPTAAIATGLASLNVDMEVWLFTASILGPTILLGAASAVGSALLFRYMAREQTPTGAGQES